MRPTHGRRKLAKRAIVRSRFVRASIVRTSTNEASHEASAQSKVCEESDAKNANLASFALLSPSTSQRALSSFGRRTTRPARALCSKLRSRSTGPGRCPAGLVPRLGSTRQWPATTRSPTRARSEVNLTSRAARPSVLHSHTRARACSARPAVAQLDRRAVVSHDSRRSSHSSEL